MHTLQNELTSPPLLAIPRSQGSYTVDIIAYDRQVGCILLKKQPYGHDKRIGYWSRSITDTEHMHDSTHQQCLVVAWSISLFLPCLEGMRFILGATQNALKWILNLADAIGKLTQWGLQLWEI